MNGKEVGERAVAFADAFNSNRLHLSEPRGADLLDIFKMACGLRSDAVLGTVVQVEAQQAADAWRLLGTFLRTELGVASLLPWDQSARVLGVSHYYKIEPKDTTPLQLDRGG